MAPTRVSGSSRGSSNRWRRTRRSGHHCGRVACLAYAVYLAELLADTRQHVRCVIDGEGMDLHAVLAIRDGGSVQFTLSWVQSCINDPGVDNIGFEFAGRSGISARKNVPRSCTRSGKGRRVR